MATNTGGKGGLNLARFITFPNIVLAAALVGLGLAVANGWGPF